MEDALNRVSKEIKYRTGAENLIDSKLIKELKDNEGTYNIAILKDEGYKYCFSFYDGEKILSIEYPVRQKDNVLDTDALRIFSVQCMTEIMNNNKNIIEQSDDIYNEFKTSLSLALQKDGIQTIQK